MSTYVFAAGLLILGLRLFSSAIAHRTLLDAEVEREMLARLDRLTPGARGRWGRFSVTQMLRHLTGALRMSTGDFEIPRRPGPLRMFPIKPLVLFVLPFPRNAPTAPALIPGDEVEFETERAALRDLIGSFAKRELDAWPEHPAFGPLSRDQWGTMVWKHLDHHFRQFGV